MNNIEVQLFRYCCRQADYSKSGLYLSSYTYFDENTKQNITKVTRTANIYFQKHILDLCKEFAAKNNEDRDYVIGIANRWLRTRNPIQKEFGYEDIKDKYIFCISDSKYYNIIPLRVYRKLTRHNDQNIPELAPSYEYFKPHVSDLEKKFFRFLVRNCTKKKCYYDGEKFWIKIDDFHKLYLNWVGRTHHTICSKNATRKFLKKWRKYNIYRKEQEKALHKKGGINYYSVIEVSESIKEHDKYIRIMPGNIYMELKRAYENTNKDE